MLRLHTLAKSVFCDTRLLVSRTALPVVANKAALCHVPFAVAAGTNLFTPGPGHANPYGADGFFRRPAPHPDHLTKGTAFRRFLF